MADDMDYVAAVIASSGFFIMAGAVLELRRRKRKKRTEWVKPWIMRAGSYQLRRSILLNATLPNHWKEMNLVFRNRGRCPIATSLHHMLVADDALPLRESKMKQF